jgi:Leucine-rich repeat (LRR) protein
MTQLFYVLLVAVLGAQQAAADCPAGTTVGPCLCMDVGGELALECTSVTDGSEITAALEQIAVEQISSIDIKSSPDLTSLPDDTFGTTAVLSLRFLNTGLESLASSAFGAATSGSLASLYIKYCPAFTAVDSALIGSLPALAELFVSSTGVSALTDPLPATALQYIDFSRNTISQISDNYFGSASALSVVLLGFNELSSAAFANATQSFAAPGSDLYLDLGYNEISEGLLGLNFPDAAPRELILSSNGITQLTEEAFSGLMDTIATQYPVTEGYVLVDNNPLKCGCEVAWVVSHPNRAVLKDAMCDNGQLLDNLGPDDFTQC